MSSPISTPQPSTNGTDSSSVAPARVLTRQRLHEPREVGEQRARAAGRAMSSVTRPPPVGLAVQRPPVVALHEPDRRDR